MLLNYVCVDKGAVQVLPCLWEPFRVNLWVQKPSKRWEVSTVGRIAHATSASSKSWWHSANGLGFIWHSQVRKCGFFTTDLKLPTPDRDQRSYQWANDEVVVSTFPYLPLSYHVQNKNPRTQSVLTYSRGWLYEVVADALSSSSHGIPGLGTGVHLLLSRVNVTDSSVPDSGMEILIFES